METTGINLGQNCKIKFSFFVQISVVKNDAQAYNFSFVYETFSHY